MTTTPPAWRCLICGATGTAPTRGARQAALYAHFAREHNEPEF